MAVATEVVPDLVMTLDVGPDPIEHYRLLRGGHLEGRPLIKCRPGRMTLVSPSKDHERSRHRLGLLVMAVCSILKIPCQATGSTLFLVPGTDRGYMPDESYYLRSRIALARGAGESGGAPPDLVIEIVNTHPADAALEACATLGVGEVWVYDVRRSELTIWRRIRTGPRAGTLDPQPASRALPLGAGDVLTRLAEAPEDEGAFDRAVRRWVKQVLVPRARKKTP
jgi:hypothetical protein